MKMFYFLALVAAVVLLALSPGAVLAYSGIPSETESNYQSPEAGWHGEDTGKTSGDEMKSTEVAPQSASEAGTEEAGSLPESSLGKTKNNSGIGDEERLIEGGAGMFYRPEDVGP